MRQALAVAALLLAVAGTARAQTTTTTDCNLFANTINCTSVRQPTPDEQFRQGQQVGQAIGGLLQRIHARREAEREVEREGEREAAATAAANADQQARAAADAALRERLSRNPVWVPLPATDSIAQRAVDTATMIRSAQYRMLRLAAIFSVDQQSPEGRPFRAADVRGIVDCTNRLGRYIGGELYAADGKTIGFVPPTAFTPLTTAADVATYMAVCR